MSIRLLPLLFLLLGCGNNMEAAISTSYPKTEAIPQKQFSKTEKRAKQKQLRKLVKSKKVKTKNGSWAIVVLFLGLIIGGIAQSITIFFIGLGLATILATIGLFRDEEKVGAIATFIFVAALLALFLGIRYAIKNSE